MIETQKDVRHLIARGFKLRDIDGIYYMTHPTEPFGDRFVAPYVAERMLELELFRKSEVETRYEANFE